MREFRPSRVRSRARLIVGLLLLAIWCIPVLVIKRQLLSDNHITYNIRDRKLTVFTGGILDRQRSVSLDQIRSARSTEIRSGRRTWGTALPGYCVGSFSYPDLGAVWQATDCRCRGVLLQLQNGSQPWLLSPPDGLDFLARLGAGTPTWIELPAASKDPIIRVLAPIFILMTLVIFGTEAVIFLGPGKLRYLVGDGAVEVRTLFSRKSWPTSTMRARRHQPHVTLRIAGVAIAGYYTGYFRADKTTTRVYATNLKDGVLLEGPARVFLSPTDIAGFLDELRAAGASVEDSSV